MYDRFKELKNQRAVKALIGITESCFLRLLEVFRIAYQEIQQERRQQGQIKCLPNARLQGVLDSLEKRLFFILFYLKVYCTFDVLGFLFHLSPGHAHEHVQALLPVIERSLVKLGLLPRHTVPDPQDMRQLLEQADALLIDGVEVPCVRPQQDASQSAHYSGKKKRHTVKSLVISDTEKRILFISPPVPGAIHDYRLMKMLFPPEQDWFHTTPLWLDLGFLGATRDYGPNTPIHLPHKRPRKSMNNPKPNLTARQRAENRVHATIRVAVEHAIGGMKAFHCLTHRIRNHLTSIREYFFSLSAGLWNLKLA